MNTIAMHPSSADSLQGDATETLDLQVCVLTYKRPDLLRLTLASLVGQAGLDAGMDHEGRLCGKRARLRSQILVIDNDAGRTGKSVVEDLVPLTSIPIRYISEPARGIASARNRALQESAEAQLVAFIDDDEIAHPQWLVKLVDAMLSFDADVVTGPVQPRHEDSPEWVKRGGFFDPAHRADGSLVPFVATNNVLLRKSVVSAFRFDPRFNATGGEDTEFFMRIRHAGHRIVWASDAIVTEMVPRSRANLRWILDRARSDANRHTRSCLLFDPGPGTILRRLLKACSGFVAGVAMLPLVILGRHHAVRGLQLVYRSFGTFKALRGHTEIYYRPSNA